MAPNHNLNSTTGFGNEAGFFVTQSTCAELRQCAAIELPRQRRRMSITRKRAVIDGPVANAARIVRLVVKHTHDRWRNQTGLSGLFRRHDPRQGRSTR